MNRHTKRMLVTILLMVLLSISGLVSSTAEAILGQPGPAPAEPPAQIVENP
ncbi:MAG: hypothetical protein GFH27_549279n392 [Chloroflexi bacterium AL-W]|nr:hypothetical protein [Chloroflexi bacterium AL-N1]NOK65358.1 hypothetical protein [Chloroflexi bacterium AL-N10]NOK72376.1 hypothetical protein [Chloroflexi bacterium AL-N5]NOK79537.1 hypothetical protein [Chloroflexi bacterium AL-W]NOK87453.1 hypothetical protein [Chloroflexi bacterium AL-N15]